MRHEKVQVTHLELVSAVLQRNDAFHFQNYDYRSVQVGLDHCNGLYGSRDIVRIILLFLAIDFGFKNFLVA
jgi:hypothetical protein